jgi:hypothetical protein
LALSIVIACTAAVGARFNFHPSFSTALVALLSIAHVFARRATDHYRTASSSAGPAILFNRSFPFAALALDEGARFAARFFFHWNL